jgi:ring-1,2-phenylacetyl-CoA epoxidase subunit PaaD
VLTPAEILGWLHEVKDPEVPVLSVVELGVVRTVHIQGEQVTVDITPTYSGCPALHVMEEEILAAIRSHGVSDVRVKTVFEEPWTTDWMSAESKEKLRAYGIAPPAHVNPDASPLVQLQRGGVVPEYPVVPCPFCGSHATILRSEFGSTACKAIYSCTDCRQPFDYFKPL